MKFSIQQVAELLGLSTSSLRRWQRELLLSFAPERDRAGRRIYTMRQIRELKRIRREQRAALKRQVDHMANKRLRTRPTKRELRSK